MEKKEWQGCVMPGGNDDTVSVVTICYNNVQDLIATCSSVNNQTIHPDEHLIIDGSTNNEILDWLTNTNQPRYTKWIHERDKGISDAMNKGIGNATGNIIHILHSGDTYNRSNAIELVTNYFENDPSLQWTHSKYVQHRGNVDVISGAPFNKNLLWKGMRTVSHPTMFVKRDLYKRYGKFDLDFKIAMDYDFLIRIRNEKFIFIPEPLIYFAPGGASNIHFKKGLREVKKSYQAHIGKSIKLDLWQFRQRTLEFVMSTHVGRKLFKLKNKNNLH